MTSSMRAIAIVGGGLIGCLTAIALARRGNRVVIFERDTDVMCRASRFNEGKIHLGFTYGLDRTRRTQETMFANGAVFAEHLRGFVDLALDDLFLHRRCLYAVPANSSLSVADAVLHMKALDGMNADHAENHGSLAPDGEPFIRRLTEVELTQMFSSQIVAAFNVAEPMIDCDRLCDTVAAAVKAEPGVEIVTGYAVGAVRESRTLEVVGADGTKSGHFDRVINAAWDGMPAIEHASGRSAHGLSLRGKTGFIARIREGMPALPISFCWGAYGDIVPQSPERAYLSWYPACRMGFTTDMSAGSRWFEGIRDTFDFADAYRASIKAFTEFLPNLVFADTPEEVRAGSILAHAQTDLHDPGSGLHRRTEFGISEHGRILAVNTGKLTCAPALAARLAEIG